MSRLAQGVFRLAHASGTLVEGIEGVPCACECSEVGAPCLAIVVEASAFAMAVVVVADTSPEICPCCDTRVDGRGVELRHRALP